MQKWEYMTIVQLWDEKLEKFHWRDNEEDGGATERLNALGDEGWELVSVDRGYMVSIYGRQFFLKRPRQ